MNTYQPHRSSLGGLDANIMAVLCYLVTFVGGLIPVVKYVAWLLPLVIVFLEKESGLVKFHAMQAFVLNLISFVVTVLITILTVVGARAAVVAGSAVATVGVISVLGVISCGRHRDSGIQHHCHGQIVWLSSVQHPGDRRYCTGACQQISAGEYPELIKNNGRKSGGSLCRGCRSFCKLTLFVEQPAKNFFALFYFI